MLLGIPFHASLAFAGGHWLVMSGSRDPFLVLVPPILSDFRMPGFFLIAGFFAAMLLERRPRGVWLAGRVERLGLPLVFGMATIVPLQAGILSLAPAGLVDPVAAADPLSHLWFLPALLWLSLLLAASWPLVKRIDALPVPRVLTLGLMIAGYELAVFLGEHLVPGDLRLLAGFVDLHALAAFGPFFAIGVALKRSSVLCDRFTRFDPVVAVAGLVALALHVGLWEDQSRIGLVLDITFDALSSLCLTQTILALLMRVVTRDSKTIDALVDASFTIYLLHHPVVIGLAIACIAASLPPVLAWLAICLGAFVVPFGVHRLLRRSPLALWLVNGVRPREQGWGLLVGRRTPDAAA